MQATLPSLAWTLIVLVFFAISANREYENAIDSAKIEARAHFNEVVNVRHWVASLGGVYAPITQETLPNPFLKDRVEERDLVTPKGKQLTLLNPAYVTRLLSKNLQERYGVYGHLISNKPVWEKNQSDPWETKAIEGFLANQYDDLIEVADRDGRPHMRYIAPLYLTRSCMACHEEQGEVGDLRGAVSVAIPLAPHRSLAQTNIVIWGGIYAIIWAFGLTGIVFFSRRLSSMIDELSSAKQRAEETSNAKSEFLASMSHDLRTPLNAILGFSQMLKFDPKHPLNTTQSEYVENVIEGGTHLLDLVNGILDLASIEADQFTPKPTHVDARKIVEECMAFTKPLATSRDISVTCDCLAQDEINIYTDRTQLKQVLLNLLSNAIKFNKDGGEVSIALSKSDDGFLRVSVADTGEGIPAEKHANVFEMFYSSSSNPYVAQQGTGIGLYVSKLLIERMAGAIGFESQVGVGSTFWLKVPLATNSKVVIWGDGLSVGVDAIDKDHQVIVRLMNQLVHSAQDLSIIDSVVMELVDYTDTHFRREELAMAVCEFPEREDHKKLHLELSKQVERFKKDWKKKRDPDIADQLHAFLQHLWIEHILKYDTKFPEYFEGNEQEIRRALKESH